MVAIADVCCRGSAHVVPAASIVCRDYECYVAHVRRMHPGRVPSRADVFAREMLARRYEQPGKSLLPRLRGIVPSTPRSSPVPRQAPKRRAHDEWPVGRSRMIPDEPKTESTPEARQSPIAKVVPPERRAASIARHEIGDECPLAPFRQSRKKMPYTRRGPMPATATLRAPKGRSTPRA